MVADKRDVCSVSIELFIAEVADLVLDGWAIDSNHRGDAMLYGGGYVVGMVRDENTIEAFRQASVGVDAKPKLTRSEILVKARAARMANVHAKLVEDVVAT